MTDDPPPLDIDWRKTIAGALAAVSSAVLLSTLGAAGTIIGAAIGSVAATVTGALYQQGLVRSRTAVLKAQEATLGKVGVAQAEVRRAARLQGDDAAVEAHLDHADETLDEARADLDATGEEPAEDPTTWRDRLITLPWKRISLLAAGLFLIAVVAITAFELATGESVSQVTGGSDSDSGTTIGGVTGGGGSSDDDKNRRRDNGGTTDPSPSDSTTTGDSEPAPAPSPSGSSSTSPSATPTESAPSPSETPSATTPADPAPPTTTP